MNNELHSKVEALIEKWTNRARIIRESRDTEDDPVERQAFDRRLTALLSNILELRELLDTDK